MIQFREVFFPLSLRLGIVLQRLRSFPTDTTHLSPTAQRSLFRPVVSRHAWLGRCTPLVRCMCAVVCAHSSVPPVLCIPSMIMQHTVRAIWARISLSQDGPAGLPR